MTMSRYLVTGNREYRGHAPGTTFPAVLDPTAEQRAIARGAIRRLEPIEPGLEPDSYRLPSGWPVRADEQDERVSSHS